MTYARRVDLNHKAIVEALRAAGWTVLDLSRVGQGCPDLLAGRGGKNILVEVKGQRGKLTSDQKIFMTLWNGPVYTVTSVDDVLSL